MRSRERHERGRRYLDDIKTESGCVVCGETELAVLDFHHLDGREKSFTLSGAACSKPLERLRDEVDKCVVLCANDHRRVHAGLIELSEGENDERPIEAKLAEHFRRWPGRHNGR